MKKPIAIAGAGQRSKPEIFLMLHKVVAQNVSVKDDWRGMRVPIVGKTSAWQMLADLGLLSETIANEAAQMMATRWTAKGIAKLYDLVSQESVYITAFKKWLDPAPGDRERFKDMVVKEILSTNPKLILLFGREVIDDFFYPHKIDFFTSREIEVNARKLQAFALPYLVARARRYMRATKLFVSAKIPKRHDYINFNSRHPTS